MRAPDFFRDSVVGQLIYYGTGRRWLQYAEDKPDFQIPPHLLVSPSQRASQSPTLRSDTDGATLGDRRQSIRKLGTDVEDDRRQSMRNSEVNAEVNRRQSLRKSAIDIEDGPTVDVEDVPPRIPTRVEESSVGREYLHHVDPEKGELTAQEEAEQAAHDPYVVHWYGPDDPECPQNVSCSINAPDGSRANMRYAAVVPDQEMVRYDPDMLDHVCYLHRLVAVRPRNSRSYAKVRDFTGGCFTWTHLVRPWLCHRPCK